MRPDVRITGSIDGVAVAALVNLGGARGGEARSRMSVGLELVGAAPREKQIQIEFDAVDDNAVIPKLLDGLFRALQPVFIGRH